MCFYFPPPHLPPPPNNKPSQLIESAVYDW